MAGSSSDKSKDSRSLEAISKGIASMVPPSFDTDDDDDNYGLKPSDLYDTLHRFWKKEHDWGWKKFMDLSKVLDSPSYQDRTGKGIFVKCGTNMRRMSMEKSDSILEIIVKQFFVEKEVTSTLVMDTLHSGLKALKDQTKNCKIKGKCDAEEVPITPIVQMESDTFILVDGVLPLLERVAIEPWPPKDEKDPQNRTQDGGWGEDFSMDTIERYERRLTELGRRTIEIFVLAHIFSKIEVEHKEAISLKRQEELIREEEEACMAGSEQKSKRASQKQKKSKKKQRIAREDEEDDDNESNNKIRYDEAFAEISGIDHDEIETGDIGCGDSSGFCN
ncbi:hypothetical protein L1987_56581 [Smallanthus sonchifolius]|uniref:Uncharacterized protein n=1 Tax=Smallanthus sonchifolius TaxID=185202 RepID=A0ACB9ECK3_9ASTR|nr:hypothetical protein L1987_56581 [Smallanthus sonchifolius]